MEIRLSRTTKLFSIILLLLIGFILLFVSDYLKYQQQLTKIERDYSITINGEVFLPTEIKNQNDDFKTLFKKYRGDNHTIKVPYNSTFKSNSNFVVNKAGNIVEFDYSNAYLADGNYDVVIEEGGYKYIFKLEVDNDFYTVIDELNSIRAGYLVVDFFDLNDDEKVNIETSFKTSDNFIFKSDNMLIPIDYANQEGEHTIKFSTEKSVEEKQVIVKPYQFRESHFNLDQSVIDEASQNPDLNVEKAFNEADTIMSEDKKYSSPFTLSSSGSTTGDFGDVRYINGATEPTKYHFGIDYANIAYTPIVATTEGVVVFSDFMPKTGNTIIVDHGYGITSHYYHHIENYVNVGDNVSSSTVMAGMGTTGYSTGVHLHFEIHINGVTINPYLFLNKELNF